MRVRWSERADKARGDLKEIRRELEASGADSDLTFMIELIEADLKRLAYDIYNKIDDRIRW